MPVDEQKKVGIWFVVKDGFIHYFRNIAVIIAIDLFSHLPVSVFFYYFLIGKLAPWQLYLIFPLALLFMTNPGSIYTIFRNSQLGEKTGFFEALLAGFNKFPRVFGVIVVTWTLTLGGCLFFIVPGLMLMYKYFFSLIAAIVEDEKASPIKVSDELVKGNFWLFFFIFVVLFGPGYLPNLMTREYRHEHAMIYIVIATAVDVIGSLAQSIKYSAYHHIRESRKEAVDAVASQKSVGLAAGCLLSVIGLVAMAVVVFNVFGFVQNTIGYDRIMTVVYGKTMTLSDDVKMEAPERWAIYPEKGEIKAYEVTNYNPEHSVSMVHVRSAPVNMAPSAARKKPKDKDVVDDILKIEGSAFKKPRHPDFNYKGKMREDTEKIGGVKWRRIAFKSDTFGADEGWILYYRVTKKDLIYTYYSFPADADNAQLRNDEAAVRDMMNSI